MTHLFQGATLIMLLAALGSCGSAGATPLKVHPGNPIWFADERGNALYLSGSHTWATRQERGIEGQTMDFDYPAYLDMMQRNGHNFLRMWAWEHAQWMQFCGSGVLIRYEPLPWPRTGPGLGKDGKPRFDVSRFDEGYFRRLRERVVAAGERGVYVAVMLFQGFSVEQKGARGVDPTRGNPWDGHPFNAANNINGVDGDLNGDGEGLEVHTLASPDILRLQEAYVKKTIDTLNDLDFDMWEIGNECHGGSVQWHYHLINFIKAYEATLPKQHLVGMTGAPLKNPEMLASPADWISPVGKKYSNDPPTADAAKVIVVDTDHIAPWGNDPKWVWKNLCRGNHFIVMDAYQDVRFAVTGETPADYGPIRRAMGAAVRLANKMELAKMRPHGELSSTGYCLAAPGMEYLVYLPEGGEATVDLSDATGELQVEWMQPVEGTLTAGDSVEGGAERTLRVPFEGDAVVHIWRG